MMAANLLALADDVGEQIDEQAGEQPREGQGEGKREGKSEWGPVFVHAHDGHLQRHKSTMRMGGRLPDRWGAGAIAGGLAFVRNAGQETRL